MVNYNLTVESSPQGIAFKLTVSGQVLWVTSPKTLSFPTGTVIEVVAPKTVGQPVGTTEKNWVFKNWEDGSITVKRTITLTADTTITASYDKLAYIPVRRPERRSQKFTAKVDDAVYQLRTIYLKPMMVEQQDETATEQANLEAVLSKILHPKGLAGIMIHHYRNYSQELFSLRRRFTAETLNFEATALAQKWIKRGLNANILKEIASAFGIKIDV
jgi:hypothetical protein